jgi:sugar phosphate isomerase/epimerase
MKPKIALSTCWLSHRHHCGYEMIEELVDLGFEYIELSHGIRIALVEGILRAIKGGLIKIVSTHNFCPLPYFITKPSPNLYEPTATNSREREFWVKNTKETIDFSAQTGANFCVIHGGSVSFSWCNPAGFIQKVSGSTQELILDTKYQNKVERFFRRMNIASQKYIKNLITSLKEIIPYAKEKNITLCIENRDGVTELPLDYQISNVLMKLPEVNYWHDVGHAQVKQNKGLIHHQSLLEINKKRLSGFHLHDVIEKEKDHQTIGKGSVDFKIIKTYFEPHHILVLEMSPQLSSEEIIESRDYVYNLLRD